MLPSARFSQVSVHSAATWRGLAAQSTASLREPGYSGMISEGVPLFSVSPRKNAGWPGPHDEHQHHAGQDQPEAEHQHHPETEDADRSRRTPGRRCPAA